MANNLMPFPGAGERVLYRAPEGRLRPKWRIWLAGMVAFGVFGLLLFWFMIKPGMFGTFAIIWSMFWGFITILSLLDNASAETLVTDSRVLHVEDKPRPIMREVRLGQVGTVYAADFKFSEVKLEDVASVMALGESVRIAKSDGTAVFLKHPGHTSNIAATLARATALAPPRTALKMRIAVYAISIALGVGWGIGLGYLLRFTPEPDGFIPSVLRNLLAAAGAFPAAVAAALVAIAVFRSALGKNELYACVQEAGMLPFVREDPNSPNALTRFCLRFVDWLYRPATTPPRDRSGE